jgi:hypothetical protein
LTDSDGRQTQLDRNRTQIKIAKIANGYIVVERGIVTAYPELGLDLGKAEGDAPLNVIEHVAEFFRKIAA